MMKFFRRPRFRAEAQASRKSFSGLRYTLSGLLLLIFFFFCGIYLFFPTDALRSRIEGEVNRTPDLQVDMEDLSLTFPPGLSASQLALSSPKLSEDIRVDALKVKPAWGSLFSTNPGVTAYASLYGGEIELEARRHGEMQAQASGLKLDVPVARGSNIHVSVVLDKATLSGAWPVAANTETQLDLVLSTLDLSGMKGLGAQNDILRLGAVTLRASGKGNAFRIDKLDNQGGQMSVTGNGTLMLTQPADRSRINLTLTLKPQSGMDPALSDMIGLLAKADKNGAYTIRILGSLANAQVR